MSEEEAHLRRVALAEAVGSIRGEVGHGDDEIVARAEAFHAFLAGEDVRDLCPHIVSAYCSDCAKAQRTDGDVR